MDEIKIIDRIKHGDRRALDSLIEAYYQTIFVYFYCHTASRETSMDLTQEVFVKMVASIENYENSGKFKSWLFTIATNHLRNHWKYESSHQEYELDEESECGIWEDITSDVDLMDLLREIPTEQKNCLILKYYYGYTTREIAEMLKVKEPTVKARIRYGLRKLNQLLREGSK